jgi:hypothetical protein
MSKKIYKSAMGKTVDLGSLILQNEHVRAVGNMGVNARGDVVDSADRVIDKKSNQVQRQYNRQTQSTAPERSLHTSTREARMSRQVATPDVVETVLLDLPPAVEPTAVEPTAVEPAGGLAAALAKAGKTS